MRGRTRIVFVDGVEYATVGEAAAAHGWKVDLLSNALNHGQSMHKGHSIRAETREPVETGPMPAPHLATIEASLNRQEKTRRGSLLARVVVYS